MSSRGRRTRIGTVAVASLALATGTLALASPSQAAPAAAPQAKVLTGSHPEWATAAADKGAVPAATQTTATVYLAASNAAGLAAYATAVSTPGNALYGHFLSAAQVKSEYLATPQQIAAVRLWLTKAGLHIVGTPTEHAINVTATPRRSSGPSAPRCTRTTSRARPCAPRRATRSSRPPWPPTCSA